MRVTHLCIRIQLDYFLDTGKGQIVLLEIALLRFRSVLRARTVSELPNASVNTNEMMLPETSREFSYG